MQKGEKTPRRMSLIDFSKKYRSEEECLSDLWEKRCIIGFVCSKCGYTDGYKIEKRFLWQCKKCKHQMKILAGTVFENSKLEVEKWYWAAFLMI